MALFIAQENIKNILKSERHAPYNVKGNFLIPAGMSHE